MNNWWLYLGGNPWNYIWMVLKQIKYFFCWLKRRKNDKKHEHKNRKKYMKKQKTVGVHYYEEGFINNFRELAYFIHEWCINGRWTLHVIIQYSNRIYPHYLYILFIYIYINIWYENVSPGSTYDGVSCLIEVFDTATVHQENEALTQVASVWGLLQSSSSNKMLVDMTLYLFLYIVYLIICVVIIFMFFVLMCMYIYVYIYYR